MSVIRAFSHSNKKEKSGWRVLVLKREVFSVIYDSNLSLMAFIFYFFLPSTHPTFPSRFFKLTAFISYTHIYLFIIVFRTDENLYIASTRIKGQYKTRYFFCRRLSYPFFFNTLDIIATCEIMTYICP